MNSVSALSCLTNRRHGYWKLFYVLVVFQLVFILTFLSSVDHDGKNYLARDKYVREYGSRAWRNSSKKTILAWTSFWFQAYWCDMSMDKGEPGQCADRCEVTTDKSRVADSDAVVFHLPDILPWTTMPKVRTPDQVWVLYNLEPPPRQIWYIGGSVWKNVFNWTLSYRQDSTVFVRPYHGYEPLSASEKKAANAGRTNLMQGKRKMAIATISDCYDDAHRYKDIHELKKYIHVDVFGYCGTETCPQWQPECENRIRDYKFQLAFENAYCQDYITEKYWEALMRRLIPVVNWKTNPAGLVFPHSYINIFDFPNTKSAAEYMLEVAANETLYNSYFDWMQDFKMNCHCGCHWCALCDALHDVSKPAQVITDPMSWSAEDTCQLWSIHSFFGRIFSRWFFNIGLYTYDR